MALRDPMLTPEEIDRLDSFMKRTLPNLTQTGVRNVRRIHGGASRETFRFDVGVRGESGESALGFILRRDPADSLIDTDRKLEYAAYSSFQDRGVPVPAPIAIVNDDSILGSAFFVMQRIDDAASASPFQPDPFGVHREAIGRDFFTILGRIAAVDPYDTEMPGVVETPAPEDCWRRELDHWEGVIEADALEPQPIAMAAIRRLRRNPPQPPPKLSIVHGDYRVGNFLHDGAGKIVAVLDWEMAHIGDPMEDVAWALDPLWSGGNPNLAAGLLELNVAIEAWQEASKRKFNAQAFLWWSLFASVKGLAIWISSSKAFHEGKNIDPILAFSGWYCTTRHNKIVADRLSALPSGAL